MKLPLSILNTLVWRGLPTERTLAAPAVTSWVCGLRDADPFLRDECGVILLGEVASVTVEHPFYDHLPEVPYQYKELLGAIWREPLRPRLAPASGPARWPRCCTSTVRAGPHRRAGRPLRARSRGLAQPALRRDAPAAAALPLPLRHRLLPARRERHRRPRRARRAVRLAIKDFVDDVNISAQPSRARLHPRRRTRRCSARSPDFLTPVHPLRALRRRLPLSRAPVRGATRCAGGQFLALVRAEILRYQARFPQLKERFETFDLFTPAHRPALPQPQPAAAGRLP